MTLLNVKLNHIRNDCYSTQQLPGWRRGAGVVSASNDHVSVRLRGFSGRVVLLSNNKGISCLLHLHKSPIIML